MSEGNVEMAQKNSVFIEQKLEEPGKFLIFTFDDVIAFAVPVVVGWLSKQLIVGFVVGLILYSLWKRIKGEGGLIRVKAAVYWFLPCEVSPYRSFPDSAVTIWRG